MAAALCFATAVFAQDANSSIEQSRLFQQSIPPSTSNARANVSSLPTSGISQSEDESFGAQQILKAQERPSQFFAGADVSMFYTNNVALTRRNTISDAFFVGDAAVGWVPWVNQEFQTQVGLRTAIFRYFDTSRLDFENINPGAGMTWAPAWSHGLTATGRYDFTELVDKHSNELLQDHEFSLALQKIIPFGRSHGVSLGVITSAGISDPHTQQRDQIGFAIGYHLGITRNLDADIGYRHSWFFYNAGGRTDLNQVGTLGAHYHINRWASVDAFVSGANNYSNRSVFKYGVVSAGGGLGLSVKF